MILENIQMKKEVQNNIIIYLYLFIEVKKNRTKEEKEALKLERQGLQRQYGYAFVDGHLEKVGNFIIEPPGLFRGRGEHPKMGTIKLRVLPEQITLNCGRSEKIPKCPVPGHHWGNIVFKPDCTWLATWTENVMGSVKYIIYIYIIL